MAFREIPIDAPESELSGVARPPGFKGLAARPGGPAAFAWWLVFVDLDGAAIAGGSATVQWYGVNFDGEAITTPEIGGAVSLAGLVTKQIQVGEGLWPWARITAITEPEVGDPTHVQLHLVPTIAGGADTDAVAAAVVAALTIPTAEEIATEVGAQAACAAAITAAELSTASAVSDLQTAVNLLPVDGDVTTIVGDVVDAKIAAIAAAVAAAVPDAGDVTDAAAAGFGAACGTVLHARVEHAGSGNSVLVAAPGAGLRIEVLALDVTSTSTPASGLPSYTLLENAVAIGAARKLSVGGALHREAESPESPLYALGESLSFGVTAGDAMTNFTIDVQYRVVATP